MTQNNGQQMYLISQLIDQFLSYKQNKPSDRSYKVFHPSAFGKCLRKMQYQKYVSEGMMDAPVQSVEPRMIRIWDTGHTMHNRWAQYMEELCFRFLREGEVEAWPLRISEETRYNLEDNLLLFFTGYAFGRIAECTPWLTGLAMVVLGGALVAITIALGG